MIATVLLWVILSSAALGYGRLLLPAAYARHSILDIAAMLFSGLLAIAAALLALSLVVPLYWWTGALVGAFGVMLLFPFLRPLLAAIKGSRIVSFLMLFSLAALIASRQVTYYDTGLYHQQAVKWLSTYGLVRGVALLHFRLGFISSWFSLAAPINQHALVGREAAILGGLLFVVLLSVTFLQLHRTVKEGLFDPLSNTWIIFGAAMVTICLSWGLYASLSPDIIVWLTPILCATILAGPGDPGQNRIRASIIAALACLVKLSAVPTLAYLILLCCWPNFMSGMSLKARLQWLGTLVLIGSIGAFAGLRASGCPVFPSGFLCVDTEWSVGTQLAREIRALIVDYPYAHGLISSELLPLILADIATTILALLSNPGDQFTRHALALSWFGIAFAASQAPSARYAMGYLLLPISLGGATVLVAILRHLTLNNRLLRMLPLSAGALVMLLMLFQAEGNIQILLPQRMPHTRGDAYQITNRSRKESALLEFEEIGERLRLKEPVTSDQCWDAELPCSPEWLPLELQNEVIGYASGFIRSETISGPNPIHGAIAQEKRRFGTRQVR